MNLCNCRNALLRCGFTFCALASFFLVIGFSTPNWLESYAESKSKFTKLGLWEACFNEFGYDRDNLGKKYNGCWWIFSYEYRPIWDWLNPRWFLAVQIMMTLVLIVLLITTLMVLLSMVGCCPPSRAGIVTLTNSILMFGTGIFTAISIIIFGVKADTDRQWITRPDKNFLSWSFGFVVLAGFFEFFAGMCLLADALRTQYENKKSRPPPPYGGYEMKRAPPAY